jgi:ectoine hydroxylase-related dioxygenase (phytanoyl-CoA dioxygenase family)
MKINYELFDTIDPVLTRNYLYTHGYMIISDFFSHDVVSNFNKTWDDKFESLTNSNLDNTQTYLSVADLIERGGFNWYEGNIGKKFLKVIDTLIGINAVYGGSSGTQMMVPTPWHRDVYIQTPTFKLACYINQPELIEGGALCVIPGSQHAGDCYADSLGGAVNWPEGGGGIARTPTFFPLLQASDNSNTLNNYPIKGALLQSLPNTVLDIKATDLVIFDQRLIHGSTLYNSGRARRMLLTQFTVNPNDVADNSRMVFRGYNKADALLELEKWAQIELNASSKNSIYQPVHDAGLSELLGPKLSLHCDLVPNRKLSTTQGERGNKHSSFYRKNISALGSPVCF